VKKDRAFCGRFKSPGLSTLHFYLPPNFDRIRLTDYALEMADNRLIININILHRKICENVEQYRKSIFSNTTKHSKLLDLTGF